MTKSPASLVTKLGYQFVDMTLLEQSLTHRSAGSLNNERLEFLGDAALGCVIAEELFERFPEAHEGKLSRLRATLVRRESLAAVAHGLDFGDYLKLGPGERKSGGRQNDSIVADALEAVLGAVYIEGGFDACRTCILSLFANRLENLPVAAALKDAKTRLQEHLQLHHLELPEYDVIEVTGKAHERYFKVECVVKDTEPTQGEGKSRRHAEQNAAELMLSRLLEDGPHGL